MKSAMTDKNKFRVLLFMTTALIVLILLSNIMHEYVMPEIEDYLEKRIYYERTISKKALSLHKGMYWKEEE